MVTVFFFYGLAFFTLGLTLLVRSAPAYLSGLRPSLYWLGTFGIIHAINEWLIMAKLANSWFTAAPDLHLIEIASGVSFTALFIAGLSMLSVRWPQIAAVQTRLALGASVTWILAFILSHTGFLPEYVSDLVARWLIGAPGALALAYGFFELSSPSRQKDWFGEVPDVLRDISVAPFSLCAISLGIYGLSTFAGSTTGFFPMSVINAEQFDAVFGFPVQVVRTVAAFCLAVGVIAAINPFQRLDREHLREQIRKTTQALRAREKENLRHQARLEQSQSVAGLGFFERNLDGTDSFWSPQFFEILGVDPLEDKPDESLFLARVLEDDRPRIVAALSAQQSVESIPFRIDRAGEVRHLEASLTVLDDPERGAPRLMATILDDTDNVVREEQLRRSQRLETVGLLAGGIAHDFNNMIQVITGNTELMRHHASPDHLDRIEDAASRAASLTERLLAFARQQVLEPVPTDVSKLVLGIRELVARTLGESIDICVEASDSWPVLVDKSQLENAVLNLAVNARDAMPGGGRLTIEVDNQEIDDAFASNYEDVDAGQYVCLTISDNGEGMPVSVQERVFEPFFTTKEVGQGTGMGLSMVYGFVKQSKGHVSLYSEPGEGTTIRIYLPRSDEQLVRAASGNEHEELGPRTGSARILVLEDDEQVREVPTTILKNSGYTVEEASNGREAIDLIRDSGPFDLLFTDVILPGGMSGPDVAKHARKIDPELRVVFTSGYSEVKTLNDGRFEEGVAMLSKPYHSRDLLNTIESALGD